MPILFDSYGCWLLGYVASCNPDLFRRMEIVAKSSEANHYDRKKRRLVVIPHLLSSSSSQIYICRYTRDFTESHV